MSYEKSLFEIFNYISKKHPEFFSEVRLPDVEQSHFFKELGFLGVFSYAKNSACELAALCDKYGSDKGEIIKGPHPYAWPSHTYSDYYQRLWGHCRGNVKRVFECGLGSNNPNFPSSMGTLGRPGASLRVWRDYFPNAQIYGADIDKNILFSEERISTYYIDQLNPQAIAKCWLEIGDENFDFIIDDGLHTFEAGSCLFTHSIAKLSEGGIYVIEDVSVRDFKQYKEFFKAKNYLVDYVSLYRPKIALGDNNLLVIRKS